MHAGAQRADAIDAALRRPRAAVALKTLHAIGRRIVTPI